MTKTNASYDKSWNCAIGSGTAGTKGAATASSATSLTCPAGMGTTQYIGSLVVAAPASGGLVYGSVTSHTDAVLTVDRWYDAVTPGGTAGTTPSSTGLFVIIPTQSANMFMGISTNASAVAAGDTVLPGEITTAGGGLIRKICTLAHTASATTGTAVAVFTANGSDSLPATNIHKMGLSNSLLSTVINLLQTVLNADATFSAASDQLTVTETITL